MKWTGCIFRCYYVMRALRYRWSCCAMRKPQVQNQNQPYLLVLPSGRMPQNYNHALHLLRALLPVPCSQSAVEPPPLHAACSAVARRPPASPVGSSACAPLVPPLLHALSRLPARISPCTACPPFDSAVGKLFVRCQQAVDPLRVGGQLGLRLCWLCSHWHPA